MFAQFTRTAAALACTVVLSATCILSAVGPATAGAQANVASTTRSVA